MITKMVVLYAHWCPKCNLMMPIVDECEKNYGGKLKVIRIDTEQEEKMEEYAAQVVPTFILFREEQEVLRMAGLISESVFLKRLEEVLK